MKVIVGSLEAAEHVSEAVGAVKTKSSGHSTLASAPCPLRTGAVVSMYVKV